MAKLEGTHRGGMTVVVDSPASSTATHTHRLTLPLWCRWLVWVILVATTIMPGVCSTAYADGTLTGTLSSPSTSQPLKDASISLTLSQAGILPASFSIAATSVSCGTDSVGSIVGVVRPLVIASTSINYASGTLPAATYYIRLTYWNASGETQVSPESSVTTVLPGTLTVNAPVLQPATASGYRIYIGTSPGTGTRQTTITGWASYSQASSLSAGAAAPSSNGTTCSFTFNDSIIPTDTVYNVSVTNSNGTPVPSLSQSWYLAGSSVNVSTSYPIAGNRVARFPLPIFASPTSNALQSVNSPLTLNGYAFTAGATILPNNASPPLTQAGRTILYTDNSGVFNICNNGAPCTTLASLGAWTDAGNTVYLTTTTDMALTGGTSSDLAGTSTGNGSLASRNAVLAVDGATNAHAIYIGTFNNLSVIAAGVTGTQSTGYPLTFRACPGSTDCHLAGPVEAGRIEGCSSTTRWILGNSGMTSSDATNCNTILKGGFTAVNAATDATSLLVFTSTKAVIDSRHTGAGTTHTLSLQIDGTPGIELDTSLNTTLGGTLTLGGFMDMGTFYIDAAANTAPSAPGSHRGRIYLKTSGGGKDEFCALFNSGAEQCFAVQP